MLLKFHVYVVPIAVSKETLSCNYKTITILNWNE